MPLPPRLRLAEILTDRHVAVPLGASTKDELLHELVALAAPNVADHETLVAEVRAREAAFPTVLGDGVALPHVRTAHVDAVHVAAGVLRHPVAFGSADGLPVDLFFLVLTPAQAPSDHLSVLRGISQLLAHPETVASLRAAPSAEAFLATIRTAPLA